jgi:hypothetical protein
MSVSFFLLTFICSKAENLYFFAMKYLLVWLLLTSLIACNEQPAPASPRPKLIPKDSIVKGELANPYAGVDVSPMDMSYLPADYPKMTVKRPIPVARVIYSRPHKQGRKIFGSLVKYGELWRLGANEATEIEFFIPVTIQNTKVAKGKYIIYCVPDSNQWTIVLNSNLYSWGLTLDPSMDLHRFVIPAKVKNQSVEYFSMIFQSTATGADLVMAWDNVEARLPLQYSEK